jgi:hypothetical protein
VSRARDLEVVNAVPETDEIRRALTTMLTHHHRRTTLAAVINLAFFRRDLPDGAFEMTTHATARVSALRPRQVHDVLSRLRTLVDTCSMPRADAPRKYPSRHGSLGAGCPLSCGAQSRQGSGLLCASPAGSA